MNVQGEPRSQYFNRQRSARVRLWLQESVCNRKRCNTYRLFIQLDMLARNVMWCLCSGEVGKLQDAVSARSAFRVSCLAWSECLWGTMTGCKERECCRSNVQYAALPLVSSPSPGVVWRHVKRCMCLRVQLELTRDWSVLTSCLQQPRATREAPPSDFPTARPGHFTYQQLSCARLYCPPPCHLRAITPSASSIF